MNFRKYFVHAVNRNFAARAEIILAETDKNFNLISQDTAFALNSKNPIDRRLDFSAYFLALIKTLDQRGENFETIRRISLEVVTEFVQPKNKIQQVLKKLPARLTNTWLASVVIRSFNKRISKRAHPDGFVANIITGKKQTFGLGYGIDIVECGICKLFLKHSYSKYVSILCEVDEITSSLAGLKLHRSGTIAHGAAKCDFRYEKIKPV